MTRRRAALVIVMSAVGVAGWAAARPDGPGTTPQQPIPVSLVRLIATPEAFEGKYVRVHGFVNVAHEGTAIYLHREDLDHHLSKNGLWLQASDTAPEGSREARVNGRYALIEGRFSAKNTGHRGGWSGAIEGITRMEPWEFPKAGR